MSLAENGMDYNGFEKEVFQACCALGREVIKERLERWDAQLGKERDRKVYRHKGQKKTVLKTLVGEVEYSRAVYERNDQDGTKSFVYLLDEAIGKTGVGKISGVLAGQIVEAACGGTYRIAAQTISELTGQSISHQTAWNVIQELGRGVDAQEEAAAALAARNKGTGAREVKVLFEEQDGIWLHLQGESRKRYGSSHEMKVAIAYEGAHELRKNRYELTGKVACANFEESAGFARRKEGKIAQTYCVDEIKTRILNGDGAKWIKRSMKEDATVVYQLDTFHRNKAIRQYVRNPETQKELFRLLYTKQTDALLKQIQIFADSVANPEDPSESEGLLKLLGYFTNNRDGLVGYHRRGLALPEPPEGMVYRRLGAMESNIFTIIGNRMKGGRACWSIAGGNNMARLLTLKHTKKLHETLNCLTTWMLPAKYAEEITVGLSAKQAPARDGKGYEGHRAGPIPSTPGYKWLRKLGGLTRGFSS